MFVEVEGAVGERVGILAPPIWDQLDFGAQETTRMAQRVCDVRYPPHDDLPAAVAKEHNGRRAFIGDRLQALAQAVTKLKEIPMVRNDVLAWFREVQRLLLEVRAWIIYETVLVPRLQTPQHRANLAQVLPIRGRDSACARTSPDKVCEPITGSFCTTHIHAHTNHSSVAATDPGTVSEKPRAHYIAL